MNFRLFTGLLLGLGTLAAQAHEDLQVLHVRLQHTAQVDTLSELGLLVDNVSSEGATVYATPEQVETLRRQGWSFSIAPEPDPKQLDGYHDYAGVTAKLQQYAENYPTITRLYTLGKSVQGRELWALLITDNPDIREDEPAFKYVATIHGDENPGTELCLQFIDLLLSNYCVDDRITGLIDETAIWIVPLMNPDGLELNRRGNANNQDLNRVFPIYGSDFTETYFNGGNLSLAGREPEVRHVMRWTLDNSFVLSANLHTGALVVNYPYDDGDAPSGSPAPTPDEDLFYSLSRRYAMHNPPMDTSRQFPGGVTNGSAWYRITGGMQDWNYRYAACMEVTLELSVPKRPAASQLPQLWEDNRESMLSSMESVHMGVRGLIQDRYTDAPLWTEVTVEGNAQPVYTDPETGGYYRLLLPGAYTLRFESPGYIPYTVSNVSVYDGPATRVDVRLSNGDVNGDGRIDAVDVQHVLSGVLKLETPYDADVDGGGVTVSDLQMVVNLALGRATP